MRSRPFAIGHTLCGAFSSTPSRLRANTASGSLRTSSPFDGMRRGLFLAALLSSWPAIGLGQGIVFTGRGDVDLDPRLERFLARRDFLFVTRDTLIAAGDSVPGSLLVAGATLTLEGTIAGALVGVDASVVLRPSDRIHRHRRNRAGGVYAAARG